MNFHNKRYIILIAFSALSGCAGIDGKKSDFISSLDDIELCNNYLTEFDTPFSNDYIASLNEQKRQHMIDLVHQMNVRGLTKPICQRLTRNAS